MMPRRQLVWRTVLATLALAALLGAAVAVLVVRSGWYNIGAMKQHFQPTFSVLELSLRYSVRHHARDIVAPPLTAEMAQRGAQVYAQHCLQCHGAPGVAPEAAMLALQPSPGPLVNMTRRWQPNELYWIVSNGVKMTGMPAWAFRLSEQEMWQVVAFVAALPGLSPQEGAAMMADARHATAAPATEASVRPDAARGRIALTQYACRACHMIPGLPGPTVDMGPPLKGLAKQAYIAGHLPTSEDNMVRWIRHPDQVKPGTAMPALQVSERDARDMARWLLSEQR